MKSKRKECVLWSRVGIEELETRRLLSGFQPTAAEQLMLEQLNDIRANPSAYGAAIGRPVLRLPSTRTGLSVPGSAADVVLARAGRLDPAQPVAAQLRAAPALDHHAITAALTSRPGQADRLIRRAMYRLMGLTEPGRHRQARPVPVPRVDQKEI